MKAEPPQVSFSLLRHSTKSWRLPSTYGRPWNHAAAHKAKGHQRDVHASDARL